MKSGYFSQDSFIMAQKQDANIATLRSNFAANPRLHLKLANNILYKKLTAIAYLSFQRITKTGFSQVNISPKTERM